METIEIGAVLICDDDLSMVADTFEKLVRPRFYSTLSAFCTELTGITQKMLDDLGPGGEFQYAFEDFTEWLDLFMPCTFCSWGRWDWEQLRRDCRRCPTCKFPSFDSHLDLCQVYRRRYGKRPASHCRAMRVLGLTPVGCHHRGLADALNIAKMFPLLIG